MGLGLKADPREPGRVATLRAAALVVLLAATFGSLGVTAYVGGQNSSSLLRAVLTTWVTSPFVGAVLANRIARQWEIPARTTLYGVMLIISFLCLGIYADVAFGSPQTQPGAFFLFTPLVSWALVAIAIAMGARGMRKSSRGAAN